MNPPKPLKRHPKLQPLSREHHWILQARLRLRHGIKKKLALSRLAAYCIFIEEQLLSDHFEVERKLWSKLDPSSAKEVIDRQSSLLKQAKNSLATIESFALDLYNCIRYEERVLFERLQKEQLEFIEKESFERSGSADCPYFQDAFWKS
jgi:hypothetical protein